MLWDLKLIIEFPPGSTILIPSALFYHSNIAVADDEVRYSLTQYSAGGIFRWVACGFQSQKQFESNGNVHAETGSERWVKGLEMLSTLEEIRCRAGLYIP